MPDAPKSGNGPVHPGRYLEQVVLHLEVRSLLRRAASLALSDELAAVGVVVDQVTGAVTISNAKKS